MNPANPKDIRQRSFEFALRVVRLCNHLDRKPGVGRTLSRQLLRSGTSVGANLEEALAGQSKADFINKNAIALKEARETIYWLRLISGADVINPSRLTGIQSEAVEIAQILGAIIVNTKVKKPALMQRSRG